MYQLQPRTGPRAPRPRAVPLSREETRQLFSVIDPRRPSGIRNRALFAMLYRGALRISATLRMMPTDIDWQRRTIRIYKDKRGKSRCIPLDAKVFEMMHKWNAVRTARGIGDDKPFFCGWNPGHEGDRVSRSRVSKTLAEYARNAGLRHVNLHLLRHTGASELLEEGFDVPTISRILGHAKLTTTYIYLHELRPDLMNVKLGQREW